jgi:hypothetical protein
VVSSGGADEVVGGKVRAPGQNVGVRFPLRFPNRLGQALGRLMGCAAALDRGEQEFRHGRVADVGDGGGVAPRRFGLPECHADVFRVQALALGAFDKVVHAAAPGHHAAQVGRF